MNAKIGKTLKTYPLHNYLRRINNPKYNHPKIVLTSINKKIWGRTITHPHSDHNYLEWVDFLLIRLSLMRGISYLLHISLILKTQ